MLIIKYYSVPVAASSTDLPSWSITVNDTNAIWAYVRALHAFTLTTRY